MTFVTYPDVYFQIIMYIMILLNCASIIFSDDDIQYTITYVYTVYNIVNVLNLSILTHIYIMPPGCFFVTKID